MNGLLVTLLLSVADLQWQTVAADIDGPQILQCDNYFHNCLTRPGRGMELGNHVCIQYHRVAVEDGESYECVPEPLKQIRAKCNRRLHPNENLYVANVKTHRPCFGRRPKDKKHPPNSLEHHQSGRQSFPYWPPNQPDGPPPFNPDSRPWPPRRRRQWLSKNSGDWELDPFSPYWPWWGQPGGESYPGQINDPNWTPQWRYPPPRTG